MENPADLRELQIRSVKKVVLDEAQLSRGQKKRLKKKERFLNSQLIEQKGRETEEIHRAKLQALREAERASAAKVAGAVVAEDAMEEVQTRKQEAGKKKRAEIGDFSGLSSILESI